ncbi:uncharacterized protein LOC114445458 [Parambassis ranga]|uniref:Uncharacterized protein LOC114445458 n=1 Tax=Parambassis ranga TaxID=210632 RepID=A0A6P7JL52_9TELE|nr:uncharacterized protein LOC114445458 [Parambassis ranga]
MFLVQLALVFFWATQDVVSCVDLDTPRDVLTVALGDSLTLNCTYNCATGFIRGCWSTMPNNGCQGDKSSNISFCTVSLSLSNVSSEDHEKNYTCYTEDTDDPKLPQKTERIISLKVKAPTIPNWTMAPKTKNSSLNAKPDDSSGGEFTGIKVLASVTVIVAIALATLAVYLCVNRNRQNWNGKDEPVGSRPNSPQPPHAVHTPMKVTQNERVNLRIPLPENESDTEVPYADIMITVRGVSTPELTQVGYLSTGDQKERWGEDSRYHLQASRSADRLHVPQLREVSRKMSTNSEYAVITYA